MSERLAFSIREACNQLGVGETYFRDSVMPTLKVVRVGRRTLIPRVELERWLDRNGARLHG